MVMVAARAARTTTATAAKEVAKIRTDRPLVIDRGRARAAGRARRRAAATRRAIVVHVRRPRVDALRRVDVRRLVMMTGATATGGRRHRDRAAVVVEATVRPQLAARRRRTARRRRCRCDRMENRMGLERTSTTIGRKLGKLGSCSLR